MENGREARKDNDLFFTCALIDYIARKTKNTRALVHDECFKLSRKTNGNKKQYEPVSAYKQRLRKA